MIDEYLTSYQLCRGILCVPFIFILCLGALGKQEIQTINMINFQFGPVLCNAVFRSRIVNFQTRGGTFRGTLYKAISTLLLPKRPLSKCSFYRLITLTGTMQCGDTQTSFEVFIFNFSAPTQAQRRLLCCKYDYQSSSVAPELVLDQFVHLSGGTF